MVNLPLFLSALSVPSSELPICTSAAVMRIGVLNFRFILNFAGLGMAMFCPGVC